MPGHVFSGTVNMQEARRSTGLPASLLDRNKEAGE